MKNKIIETVSGNHYRVLDNITTSRGTTSYLCISFEDRAIRIIEPNSITKIMKVVSENLEAVTTKFKLNDASDDILRGHLTIC